MEQVTGARDAVEVAKFHRDARNRTKTVEGAPIVVPQRERPASSASAERSHPRLPYEPGVAMYRQILPGIMQVPADAVLAHLAASPRSGR